MTKTQPAQKTEQVIDSDLSKADVLAAITTLASKNSITRDEITDAYDRADRGVSMSRRKFGISDLMYLVGAIIIAMSVFVFISQFWDSYTFGMRLFVTALVAVGAFVAGYFASRSEAFSTLTLAAYLVGAAVVPLVVYVVVHQLSLPTDSYSEPTIVFLLSASIVGVLYYVLREVVVAAFASLYATLFVYACANFIAESFGWDMWDVDQYVSLFVGCAYITIGYLVRHRSVLRALTSTYYLVGSFLLLLGGFLLGSWHSEEMHGVWDAVALACIAAVLYGSVRLGAKSMLISGALFLVLLILRITSVYFSETLGWPFALMLSGFAIIGVSYLAMRLNKYINAQRP